MAELGSLGPISDAAAQEAANRTSNEFFDFSKTNTRRSFVLLSLSAVTGLIIAGYGLFTAKGTTTERLPPEDIALVNQRPIYRSDFGVQTQAQYALTFDQSTHEQRQRVLDDMINEELLVQRGMEVDLPAYDPEVRIALVNGVELQMYADVLAKQPSEVELKTYYEQHRDQYSNIGVMRLRDVMLNGQQNESPQQLMQRAQQVVTQLRGGALLNDAFMQKYGLRDSGKLTQGGKPDLDDIFDFAAAAKLGPKIYAEALQLQGGQTSDPVADSDGLHIVVMNQRKPPRALDYEAVRARVWTDLQNEEKTRIRDATLKYLRSKADIRAAADY